MKNIVKFFDGYKSLFIFELDSRFAVIAPELMAFENYKDEKKA
ncbi:hypothetical protein [Paenibacillus sp. FSL E2-0178]